MKPLLTAALFLVTLQAVPLPAPRPHADDPPPELMRVLKALLDASRRYGVDPGLVFAVAWNESTLKPRARSRRDGKIIARGLMQISAQYQDELVAKYLGWHPSHFHWDNPEHSALLGCAMLADYVKRFGRWGALAVYNCGEGRYRQLWHGRALPQETVEYQRRILTM